MKAHIRAKYVLIALILLDAVFIQLHRLYGQQVLGSEFSIELETGYAEYYQHAKELVIAMIAFALMRKSGELLYLFWTLLFAYLFLDDTFEIHEKVGKTLDANLSYAAAYGLRARDYGELLVFATAGLFFTGLLAFAYRRGGKQARHESKVLFLMLLVYAFFAVVTDMAHIIVVAEPWNHRLGILEEGGEMLVMSIMLWYLLTKLQKYNH